ncbi:hypothetical protein AXE80_03220 [Wenyingzhuangia fucanilytica]|uniref:Heparinase II/III-like protein n=1 Tax=Wenyingzhuangia fucanilytica TaxID=1790137 RepID=A0A1B1Y3P2_9FLAO|nr:heparinase II/III family protein [Wenyingzhuangia fucanilytica]ANW95358.1 hypothetical protein AXE80_03220 [Wenyingzhuangia fucanilytica]
MKQFAVVFFISFLLSPLLLQGQDLAHPRIYTTDQSREDFLKSIEENTWKKSLVDKKIKNLEKYLEYCENDATWLVSRLQMNWKTKHSKVFLKGGKFDHSEGKAPVPTVRFSGTRDWDSEYKRPSLEEVTPYFDDKRGLFLEHKNGKKEWIHPSKAGFAIEKINEQIMSLVEDAAFLYWFTGDKKYAEFAKPVFETYTEGMYYRDAPIDLENGNQQRISGLATFEVIHEKILGSLVTTYDFLYDYFKKEKVNMAHADAVFQKWGDQIIINGIPDNNWNLFQARYLTYVALVLDTNSAYKNGKGREYFLDHTFTTSTERQLAIEESLLVYDQQTGIWPESASYSVHVITTLLNIYTLLDQFTNKNELANYPIIEKAALASFQYLFPSGYLVGFGDSNHKPLPAENFELLISNYRKYGNTKKEQTIASLLNQMIEKGEYKRKADDLFQLFFYVDELNVNNKKADLSTLTSPTFYAPNVSMFNQRLGKDKDAVMVSLVGSYGNHSHVNGISMELYANQYVLGPDMGKGPSYWHTDHRDYYSRFPAHNTVVVNGKSDYNAMRGYHPFTLDNYFPKTETTPLFNKLTYGKVSFVEPKTNANQQRFTAIVKAKDEKSYIVDVFRSKTHDKEKQRHDYFYHNLGQSLEILDKNNSPLTLDVTKDFGSKDGDIKAYNYLKDKKKINTTNDVCALYTLSSENQVDNLMKIWIKGSEHQSVYTALAPKANVLTKGTAPKEVLDDEINTLIVKREGAAWNNPFAMVFNPYLKGEDKLIENVTYSSVKENPSTQIITVLHSDKNTTDNIILNVSENEVVSTKNVYQKGLTSIVRTEKNSENMKYMFLSGMIQFEQYGWTATAVGTPVTISIESIENGFVLENDGPVVLKVPFLNGKKTAELRVYENGKIVAKRNGQINRSNPNQLEFRLHKAYQKAEIIF